MDFEEIERRHNADPFDDIVAKRYIEIIQRMGGIVDFLEDLNKTKEILRDEASYSKNMEKWELAINQAAENARNFHKRIKRSRRSGRELLEWAHVVALDEVDKGLGWTEDQFKEYVDHYVAPIKKRHKDSNKKNTTFLKYYKFILGFVVPEPGDIVVEWSSSDPDYFQTQGTGADHYARRSAMSSLVFARSLGLKSRIKEKPRSEESYEDKYKVLSLVSHPVFKFVIQQLGENDDRKFLSDDSRGHFEKCEERMIKFGSEPSKFK